MSLYEKLIDPVLRLPVSAWEAPADQTVSDAAVEGLEAGRVLLLAGLGFEIATQERRLMTPALLGTAKNASFDPLTGRMSGTTAAGPDAEALRELMARFSGAASALAGRLFPRYRDRLVLGRASFRPAEIAGRPSSWRKDDTRLHVDSFPATPTGGRRILRVFTNVNPEGRPRVWRVGGPFESVAERFAAALRLPLPGAGRLLALLRVTKSPRTPYDALMLQLHDRMKADAAFQSATPQATIDFHPGWTWAAFTDEVSHAAMSGQYQLEHTFLLPVAAMAQPERSPLRVLERLKGRPLV